MTTMTTPHDDGRRLTESPQRTHPGWTRLQWKAEDGHDLKTQYRGPGGEVISRDAFMKRVKAGEILTIDAETGEAKVAPSASSSAALNDPPMLGAEAAPAPEPFNLPDAQASGARPAPGQASPAELSLTFQIGLVVLSSLAALFSGMPELSMSELEAQAIGVPLANITAKSRLNQKFGRYLANSSDYTLLGYALYAYSYRVGTTLAARHAAEAAQPVGPGAGGFAHAVQTAAPAARSAQPAPASPVRTVPVTEPNGSAIAGDGATAPASGGIAAASRGSLAAEAARIVGYRPIQNPRAG